MQPQQLTYTSHGQPLCWHLLRDRGRGREVDADPQATTTAPSKAANLAFGEAACFKPERWPLSNRNGGRLQIGTAAAFKSGKPAAFSWNLH
jgi:hypothetical protein